MARVKTFEQFPETAPCLATSGSVSVIAIEPFAGFDVIDKLIEKIPDIRTVEKARVIDPFGHAGLTPLGEIKMTLAGEIKMTPVEASAGEFFCSFETPCPGTAGINLKNYRI